MINLDANDPSQVVSKTELEVDIGPQEKIYILSGIACLEWVLTDDDHQYAQEVVINLQKPVKDVVQSTVTVGLASIENDHSAFLFSADTATIDQDDLTQVMLLRVQCSARGDVNKFHRFSYQVVAKVTTQVTGISGRIFWPTSLFDGIGFTDVDAAQAFQISANVITSVNNGGFGSTVTTQKAAGSTGSVKISGDAVEVPYEILGAPYGTPLWVIIDVSAPFPVSAVAQQVSGPEAPIMISTAVPGVASVDFEVFQVRGIK